MIRAEELLDQARRLAGREEDRVSEVDLRRAVSSACYALFHLLSGEAAALVCPPELDRPCTVVRRACEHGAMKRTCNRFAQGRLVEPWDVYGEAVPDNIRRVARLFVELQEKRHAADYDISQSFSKYDVDRLVALTAEAFACWQRAKEARRDLAGLFLLALLFGECVRR